MTIEQELKKYACDLGFCFCNIANANIHFDENKINQWYACGYAADMKWLIENTEKRISPSKIFDNSQSIIVCGLNYYQQKTERNGDIARYALGRDYHKIFRSKLSELIKFIENIGGKCRMFCDTAPIMERPIAQTAGAGWIGKNSILINKQYGSYILLGEIFTTLQLEADEQQKNSCGNCTKCIDVCPTHAIVSPYNVDSNKCISYLTIENKNEIPEKYRKLIGNKLYGCDACLDVCPWNKNSISYNIKDLKARKYPDLKEILELDEILFSKYFAGSPIHRIKLERLQRNACVVAGNIGDKSYIDILKKLLLTSTPMLKEHIIWALSEIEKREVPSNLPVAL